MTLYQQLQADRKIAFKAREKTKKDILNFVIAQIKQKQIDTRKDLTDDEVMKVIKKEIKMRHEALAFLEKADKEEDIIFEKENIAILEVYLPEMLSEEQLRDIVQQKIEALGITDLQKQRGMLIGTIMKEYGATVDGGLLNQIITSLMN